MHKSSKIAPKQEKDGCINITFPEEKMKIFIFLVSSTLKWQQGYKQKQWEAFHLRERWVTTPLHLLAFI